VLSGILNIYLRCTRDRVCLYERGILLPSVSYTEPCIGLPAVTQALEYHAQRELAQLNEVERVLTDMGGVVIDKDELRGKLRAAGYDVNQVFADLRQAADSVLAQEAVAAEMPVEMWACGACTFQNTEDKSVCEICNNPRT
jgi:hypothetical protein